MNRFVVLLLACTAGAAFAHAPADPVFSPASVRAHVAFLADDLLEGRDIGSRGYDIAARYVASEFDAIGLTPAGDDGDWYQRITFQKTSPGATPASLTITGPAPAHMFAQGDDVIITPNALERAVDLSAPLVFVGYGIADKAVGIDDYRGLDVTGKIVVALSGYPDGIGSEEGAHLNSSKAETAEARGAIGFLTLPTLKMQKIRPWSMMRHYAEGARYTWVSRDGVPFVAAPRIRGQGTLNTSAAQAIFAGARQSLDAVLKAADKPGARPRGFALKTSARLQSSSSVETITSPNVAAMLPGSDPTLKNQYVVLSAHLDHIGIADAKPGDAPDKDRINNGALDNAAGIATMLEVARAFAQSDEKPRRSIVFLASTGEEKGLLGADYYARHPTVPATGIVGNVDLDMPLLLYPFKDVIAFGADHSTLGPLVAEAVAPMGVTLIADPMPEQGIFTRSDHYMFVKQGVPAVFLATGYGNGGKEAWESFLGGNYHHPGDDLNQPIDWQAGARFAEANYRITRAMADADTPPLWYKGDYFGNLFAPEAAKAEPAQK
ncbi:M28 family metallopeptidase [Hephaestia sp. GCM10023244]|uniref:M28 family metallopeptidase n=1 Tax=unclassified Hephaestia TaxID=2631281 RepID=UPI0020777A74|nr:M28 family metallopeptidase [Hephaestia sp. MAHUQ-44]MCM8730985.1 M28 family metallopeptidase [Hephaestia sp. MAHUQ-44]